jgi:hypothetical protein
MSKQITPRPIGPQGHGRKPIIVLWAIMGDLYLYMADQRAKNIDIPDEVSDAHHEAAVDFHAAGGHEALEQWRLNQ